MPIERQSCLQQKAGVQQDYGHLRNCRKLHSHATLVGTLLLHQINLYLPVAAAKISAEVKLGIMHGPASLGIALAVASRIFMCYTTLTVGTLNAGMMRLDNCITTLSTL